MAPAGDDFKHKPTEPQAKQPEAPPQDPQERAKEKQDELGKRMVVLTQEAVDANGRKCPMGTVISPDKEGWPAHRVEFGMNQGWAEEGSPEDFEEVEEKPRAEERKTLDGKEAHVRDQIRRMRRKPDRPAPKHQQAGKKK